MIFRSRKAKVSRPSRLPPPPRFRPPRSRWSSTPAMLRLPPRRRPQPQLRPRPPKPRRTKSPVSLDASATSSAASSAPSNKSSPNPLAEQSTLGTVRFAAPYHLHGWSHPHRHRRGRMVQQRTSSRAPWWVRLIVLVGALLTGAGGVIALANPAMLAGPQPQIGTAAHVFAGYFAARNLVLACVLLLLLAMQAQRALGQLLALVGLIQCADAVLDCVEGRWP